jgi:maltose O-acetyltransferase
MESHSVSKWLLLAKAADLPARLFEAIRYFAYRRMFEIHPSFKFKGRLIYLFGPGRIKLGVESYLGSYSSINAAAGYSVQIGKGCSVSHNVRIYTMTDIADQVFDGESTPLKRVGSVTIGDFAWIGANVYIGPGITIGANAVVGANSVVVSDVPERSIVGGVPAKLIRTKSGRGG